jgi:alpha-beta hydrolase superfamily lysophospholipase
LYDNIATMDDGYVLPLYRWTPTSPPRAIVVALHGFNDYGTAFRTLGEYLAGANVLTLAYDQRGFGHTTFRGRWPGSERLIDDVSILTAQIHARYPTLPLYVFGESMGAAVALAAGGQGKLADVAGLILSAPAVWGPSTMSPLMRVGLWLGANLLPGYHVTGEGLKIMASDNRNMLIALGRDPLVIKRTRIDAIAGLSDLMDAGLEGSTTVRLPTLVLYGARDQVIPKAPICTMLQQFADAPGREWKFIEYPQGYHMLTRDLQRERVLHDVVQWIQQRSEHRATGLAAATPPAWCEG